MLSHRLHFDTPPQLFQGQSIEDFKRVATRPLGPMSDYVVEELPRDLDRIWHLSVKANAIAADAIAALSHKIARLADTLNDDDQILGLNPADMAVARTDIIYIYNAFIQLGKKWGTPAPDLHKVIPRRILKLGKITAFTTSSLPILTYEDLIFCNPLETDPRTFAVGKTGGAEKDFCNGHRYIEYLLGKAIHSIHKGISSGDADIAQSALETATKYLSETCDIMKIFRDEMPKEHFGIFRDFFGDNPFYDLRGPSGRFSAKVAHITILLVGEKLDAHSEEFYSGLFSLSKHYPAEDFFYLAQSISPEFCPVSYPYAQDYPTRARLMPERAQTTRAPTMRTLMHQLGSPRPLYMALQACADALDTFTRFHITAAHKHVVHDDRKPLGTADRDQMRNVLKQRLRISGLICA